MPRFLHVGCGPATKVNTTAAFAGADWQELRLDIDASVKPDIIGSMTDMSAVPDASFDALFSSHNLEHLYPHEVPVALKEFRRVLKPEGFAVITCPDLQSICALVAEGKLLDAAYESPSGPISALDVLYGHRPALAAGNLYMAHRCGFVETSLREALCAAGFKVVATKSRPHPSYDLWALACVSSQPRQKTRDMAATYLP
ncbi:Methyltransferase domain-containing protein [Solimonas aquatica]|uniref:Methyltransferase domain-containing protein n=1 Tax=Solimonas aquatica TaxID=489703 RepID=A0A1H9BTC6_9GAMM|nr:class I SAM-dependent methyltransferase [Solimonas aquatica]SEP92216.1 Methyltransferase domain-containing protein [Solimonas aquatica]